jgi:AmmeMemoRadiSam system protein B/AmmeMemoRadiSam system protein A
MKKIITYPLTAIAAFVFCTASGTCENRKPSDIRPPAVAEQFYPSDPAQLKQSIQRFLQDSVDIPMEDPIAILVPHAGYVYSGQIAADAYRQVMGRRYDVVVILGVNHTTPNFSGIALGPYKYFHTPLGDVPLDASITNSLLSECKDCNQNREVHETEHSIEVQIPFIQVLFPNAKIVPAIIHPPDFDLCIRFGKALAKVLKNQRALIVISSDLSHYPNSNDAVKADRVTLEALARLNPTEIPSLMKSLNLPNLSTRACGEAGILAGITAAKGLGATRAVIAGYANSGDISVGDSSRAVGYGAIALTTGSGPSDTKVLEQIVPPLTATPLQDLEKKSLLAFARETIQRFLTTRTVPLARNFPARIYFRQGAFVTLRKNGQLRGCIGRILPDRDLGKTVGAMAIQAAFNDPRVPPLGLGELKNLEIEISILTPIKPIATPDQIVVGRDGVILYKEGQSAVFLPQVASENNWNRAEMLDNLCLKAGLPAGCWKRNARFETFQAEVFSESQIK